MSSSKTISLLGSMKVAEGITRFCPVLYLLDKDTLDWDKKLERKIEVMVESAVEE
jgi:hypothetical protein